MFSQFYSKENDEQPSLYIRQQFSYIDMVQDDLSLEEKKKKMNIHSKIIDVKNAKKKGRTNNKLNLLEAYKSEVTKKSLTKDKQKTKGILQHKNKSSKSLQQFQEDKRYPKVRETRQIKQAPLKLKFTKSSKNFIIESNKKQSSQKKTNYYFLKKNKKKRSVKNEQKSNNNTKTLRVKNHSHKKNGLKTCRSQTSLDKVFISEISPLQNALTREDKIIHEYFGMENKLISIIEHKKQQPTKLKSKLSKTKTQSTNNISGHSLSKNLSKFQIKPIKTKK